MLISLHSNVNLMGPSVLLVSHFATSDLRRGCALIVLVWNGNPPSLGGPVGEPNI